MKSPRRLAALTLCIGIAGLAVAGSFAAREPDPAHASGVSAAAAAPTSEAGVVHSTLPRVGTTLLLGVGLVGLALLGRKRMDDRPASRRGKMTTPSPPAPAH